MTQELTVSPLKEAKDEARMLGIDFPNNITLAKLLELIEDKKAEAKKKVDSMPKATPDSELPYKPSEIGRNKAEAHKLIRFRLHVNNPALQQATGVTYTVGNELIGHVTRVIPFNGEAWHAEAIIVEYLRSQRFQQFTTKQRNRISYMDNSDPKILPTYIVEILPPLTEQELEDLKIYQSQHNTGRSEDTQ